MTKAEYRALVGVIDAFLRHESHRFRDAASWVQSRRSRVPKTAKGTPRRHGYSGNALRTFECMSSIAKHYRDQLHGLSSGSPPSRTLDDVEALRVLLTAWLLSARVAHDTAVLKTRPTDIGPMPVLDVEQAVRIEGQYLLSASPRWRALVSQAWTLVGDPAYMPDAHGSMAGSPRPTTRRTQRGHASVPGSVPTPSAALDLDTELRSVTRPCDRLALQAYRWAESLDPSREKPERARVDPALWLLIEKGKCPFYPRGNPPSQPTGLKYVRRALTEINGPRYTRRSGRTIGRSIATPRDLQ